MNHMIFRHIYTQLMSHLPKKEFTILIGARQTGKSTLLRQMEKTCKEDGMPTLFINLEQKPLLEDLNDSPLNLLRYLPQSDQKVIVFLDEVQYLDDPSNLLKIIFDEHGGNIKIIASGSSAFYIDKKFKDSLAGRKRIFQLTSCSFAEYLELKGKSDLLSEFKRLKKVPESKSTFLPYLQTEWEEYMIYGGYPAIIKEGSLKDKIERLRELRDSYIERDIQESGVNSEQSFYMLLSLLAGQTGSLVNTNELSSTLRIKHETVSTYLRIMEKSFHISLVRPFFRNLRKELIKMPKIYFLDTGLRNCMVNNFQALHQRPDRGELWENTVFKLLHDRHGKEEIHYWRTSAGNEVDFVLPSVKEPHAFEVKYNSGQVRPGKYKIFQSAYPAIPLSFVHLHPFRENIFRTELFLL